MKSAIAAFYSWVADSAPAVDRLEYFRWLDSDPDSLANRKTHYRIQYRLRSHAEDGKIIAARYRTLYDEDITEPDDATILETHSALKKQLRKIRRRYLEKVAVRIRLSLKDVAYATPVFSVMIALGGYFYTSRVYAHFGIVASHFFTAGDYLSASVHAVEAAALSAVLFVASMTWRAVADANLTRFERKKYAAQNIWPQRLIMFSCIFALITADADMRATGWFGVALFVVGVNVVTFLLDRIFRSSISLVSTVSAAVVFAAMLFVQSNQTIKKIEQSDDVRNFRVLMRDSEFTSDDYSIVGSSGKYLFLWKRDDGQVKAVPHAEIRWMSLSEKTE